MATAGETRNLRLGAAYRRTERRERADAPKQASPSHGMCFECGAEWGSGDRAPLEWHHVSCPTHAVVASASLWSTCPCGKPPPAGEDTRTNVYLGDELVETRYPHADGVTCCWTREMRR